MKKREEKIYKVESAKRDKIVSLQQECTYHPQINNISRMIARRSDEPVGHYLTKLGKAMQQKRENARN